MENICHNIDKYKDLKALVNKHKKKKYPNHIRRTRKSQMLIFEKESEVSQEQEKEEDWKKLQHFQELHSFDKSRNNTYSSVAESIKSGENSSFSSERKKVPIVNYLSHV